jgi:hypothetical protein
MRHHVRNGIAAAMLLCSSGVALALDQTFAYLPSDDLALTRAEETLVWQATASAARNSMSAPAGLTVFLDSSAPASLPLHAMPAELTAKIPVLQNYEYAVLGKTVVIVNPLDHKIVDIIER